MSLIPYEAPSDQMLGSVTATSRGPASETTVLVAVSQERVREALVAMIGALEGYRVVAEAATHEEALARAREKRPTLALIDQNLPDCCGSWTVQSLRDERLATAIVALGLRANDTIRARARAAGAHAYVQMGASPDELVEALEAALTAARAPLTSMHIRAMQRA